MPRLRWLTLLLLLHAIPVSAQKVARRPRPDPNAASTPEQRMTGEFSMSGQVVDASSGEPVRKAVVRIRRGGSDPADGVTLSDASGGFGFKGLEAGTYVITADKPGYGPENSRPDLPPGQNITVGPGVDAPVIRVKLVGQGVVAGKVRDENSDPVPHVMVQAFSKVVQNGRGQWVPAGGQVTNDVGEYRLSVPPGTYLLSVTNNNPAMSRGQGKRIGDDHPAVSYPTVFYPNVRDVQTAVPLALSSGQEQHADFNLTPAATFQVRGRVTNVPSPERGVGLTLMPLRGDLSMQRAGATIDQGNGSFWFNGVTPGTYQIAADSFGGPEDRLAARQTITVGESDVSGIELTLSPMFNVPVHLRTEDDSPVPGAQVYLMNDFSHQMLGMGPDKDGAPIIRGISPGTYRLGVSPGSHYYVKSATLGGVDILDRTMEWNGPSGPVDIVLGKKGASLSGHIGNGSEPVSSADVLVLRQTPEGQFALARQVHATGADFTASALGPGHYVVLAAEDARNLEYADPAVLRKYQDYTQSVSVDEGGEQQLQLKLAPVL